MQPGGEEHRSGTSPPEREGQVCPHCGLRFTVCCVFSDYKNNLLKEKARLSSPPKVIDLDRGHSDLIFLQLLFQQCKCSLNELYLISFSFTSVPQRCRNFQSKESKFQSADGVAGWSRGCAPNPTKSNQALPAGDRRKTADVFFPPTFEKCR